MWNMDNFYDFNEEFDGTTVFRQQTAAAMQQPNDSGVSATAPIASAPSAVSAVVSELQAGTGEYYLPFHVHFSQCLSRRQQLLVTFL